ncbi:MAG: hypothetical protein IIU65_02800, partial [Clostridia bacterium]|nr:hypothetical protein [Clostridia bacterium]
MGSLAGTPERTDFSVWEMLIDYVRVYRLEDVKDYEKYQIFEAENLEHSNKVTTNYMPCAQKCVVASNSDMSLYLKDIEAGNYDVYVDYVGVANDGSFTAYFNGQRANTISLKRDYNAQMKYSKVGSITVEEKTDFQLKFKRASGTLYLDKVFLVKTDNQSDIILNNANSITTSNYIEVANEEELVSALGCIKHGGTIKFLNDIELTKNLILHHEINFDFNGKTLTVNGGYLAIGEGNKPTIIKNGNVIISGKSSNFIQTTENNYNAKVKCEDLNITINSTASWGYVFNHNYGSIDIEANNCEFTFGEKVSSTSTYIIARNTGIYNNCTFNLNGRKAFLMSNGSNKSTRKLHLNNCIVNDALYLFHSDNALTNYVDVKLANTTINNLTALTNFEENAQFVSVADNGALKQNSETVSISANMTGNFTMECNHSYVDADCTTPKHCEYCNLIEGKALGHISDNGTVTKQADCYYSEITKYTCTKCGELLEEKETAPIKGHDYTKELCGEQTCTTMRYYKYSCKNCEYYYTDAADTDISGAYTYKGHV